MTDQDKIEAAIKALNEVEEILWNHKNLEAEFSKDLVNSISMMGRMSDELAYAVADEAGVDAGVTPVRGLSL